MSPIWTNWAGDQRCAPASIARPASEAELVEEVGRAAEAGRTVRVAGSGHSFTDAACTDGQLIRLDRMRRVLSADPQTGLVEVQAGITLHELGRELAARGLAMENQGDIDRQTLGGAISTATHGTGARFRNLSAQVTRLRLITGEGELVELAEESDPDALLAARVGVGSLGAIASVTLCCVPLFTLYRVDEPRPLDDTLRRLAELADENDHFELYAFPYTQVALTRSTARTDREPEPEDPRKLFVQEVLLENRLIDALGRLGRRFPVGVPLFNRRLAALVGRSVRIDHAYRVYASRRDVRFTEMEYAIPREAAAEAVERVLDLVARRRLPVGFPIEVRFVAADDAYLSPSFGRDTCYVAVHQYRGVEFESYFRAVEAIMSSYGGRPHWGKRHYRTAAELRSLYPQWDRFQTVRERLDPHGVFANDYTDRVLGPAGSPVAARAS